MQANRPLRTDGPLTPNSGGTGLTPPLSGDGGQPALSIPKILADAAELAALPQVVMRIIDMTVDPKATAADLEKIIGTDQVLAAKLLTLANSPYYGLPRRISSLREAVVFLGFTTLRRMAMTVTTFNLCLGKSDAASLHRRAIWRHSLNTAQCARVLHGLLHPTTQAAFTPDQAYTACLLHDIGKVALDQSCHTQFCQITELAAAQGKRFQEIEYAVLPFSHAQIGAALTAQWNLPPMLCEAIAFHHTPGAAELNPKLAAATCLANEIAHNLAEGHTDDETGFTDLRERCGDALFPLRITEDSLRAMRLACRVEMDKGLAALSF